MTTPAVPTWPALLMSMAFGEVEEGPFTGLLRITEPPSESVTVRVFKRFGEYRVETLGGELVEIRRHRGTFRFAPGIAQPAWLPDDDGHRPPHAHAIERRELRDWGGEDFTRPTGPPQATIFLGRTCWEIEFAPPEHKTSPLTLTIDAATGMQLKAESRDFGVLEEWIEIEFGVELDNQLFGWDGPTITDHELWCEEHPDLEEHERRSKREQKQERKWLKKSGLRTLRLRADLKPEFYEVDRDTGELYCEFIDAAEFTLTRQQAGKAPWTAPDRDDHEARWNDGEWEWRLRSDSKIRKRTLKHLRRQTRRL